MESRRALAVGPTFRLPSPFPTHISSKRATLQGGSLAPIRSVHTFSSTDMITPSLLGAALPPGLLGAAPFPAGAAFPDIGLSACLLCVVKCLVGVILEPPIPPCYFGFRVPPSRRRQHHPPHHAVPAPPSTPTHIWPGEERELVGCGESSNKSLFSTGVGLGLSLSHFASGGQDKNSTPLVSTGDGPSSSSKHAAERMIEVICNDRLGKKVSVGVWLPL